MKSDVISKTRRKIIEKLVSLSDISRKEGAEKYLKYMVKSRGMTNPNVKKAFGEIKLFDEYKSLSFKDKFDLALNCFQDSHIEDKIVSQHILNSIHKSLNKSHIDQIKDLFKQGFCNEWATCDGMCVHVFKHWTKLSKENATHIANFMYDKENLWVRRASCVSFVVTAKHGEDNFKGFNDLMFEVCKENVKYTERFNQLGVGWLLRELSQVDYFRFHNFVLDNYKLFSREGLRYAIEKLDEAKKKKFLSYRESDDLSSLKLKIIKGETTEKVVLAAKEEKTLNLKIPNKRKKAVLPEKEIEKDTKLVQVQESESISNSAKVLIEKQKNKTEDYPKSLEKKSKRSKSVTVNK